MNAFERYDASNVLRLKCCQVKEKMTRRAGKYMQRRLGGQPIT
jgi:hypothetical protein